jgi:SAM-dependent methyltransferase
MKLLKKHCKICGHKFFNKPLLQYKNMPSVAQNLPDAAGLKNDRGMDLDVYQCGGCGLVQLDVEPVPYYKEIIRAAGYSREMKDFRLKQFTEFVKEYSLEGKKVLEVGCGRGEYLSLMQAAGAKAYGLEYGDESLKICRENGLEVIKGFLDKPDYKIPAALFDAFFIISFFEHLPNPNAALQGIYNNLSDSGVGIVEVPNFDMMLRENLFSEFMRDHLCYFTKQTLATALELNGFEIISCSEVWHEYIISAAVKKRRPLNLGQFSGQREKIKAELYDFISQNNKVAIWGAGHQAFAIMAMIGLGGKIQYIVDSAPFKQGKFSPASHIPIAAPEKLLTDPVDAVIIMAGSYSDEIKKILKEKFDKKIKVAVLREFGLEIEA